MSRIASFGEIELDRLERKLAAFPEEVKYFAQRVLNQPRYKNILIAFNIENLDAGLRPDGSKIEKVPDGTVWKETGYERYTRYLKQQEGKIYDRVTLQETGQMVGSLDVKVGSDSIYIVATDPKAALVEEIWGQFLGVNESQLYEFTLMILPEFEKFVKKYFNEEL